MKHCSENTFVCHAELDSASFETLKRVQGDKEGLGIIHKRLIWLL
jgi:hypothetical protein